ncbi:unnamed protein product [Tilletia controversa]|uniref:Nascent polypeptide-associated complex subunit alpha-like UBA domain-containing protein n=3 Tax=Tilletia TaxID=13289 RepID=A0A8X7SZJ5_9BASI|nr:hypothetical protein CF336_g6609 [Tilletia laevis]KAE8201373.1 hypothetical protein CF328_g2687 [Tilletia controversa]KAE8252697.1 hypothetical protein A4X03_0g6098 [Tilletia caries]KAE8191808.1 hypothetical protein CF335_g5990 [Tilletia laevis]KAE8253430.1 hypothetical protein A4X06_0g1463 [Tilletia controversa]
MASRAEVIQDWADVPEGVTLTFERGRMDKALNEIVLGDRPAKLPASFSASASPATIEGRTAKQVKDDVDTISKELWISPQQAEVLLVAAKGDLAGALQRGVQPPPNWPK